nr:MarR family transcriptional regulator [Anaerosolibacter carboniphilus]
MQTIFNRNLESYFSKWSLTSSQILVLSLLYNHLELRISEIASSIGLPDSNVSGIIDRLEKAGYVERSRNTKDRRVVNVKLTDKVNEIKNEFDLNLEEYFQQLLEKNTQKEIDEIAHKLEKLKSMLLQFKG